MDVTSLDTVPPITATKVDIDLRTKQWEQHTQRLVHNLREWYTRPLYNHMQSATSLTSVAAFFEKFMWWWDLRQGMLRPQHWAPAIVRAYYGSPMGVDMSLGSNPLVFYEDEYEYWEYKYCMTPQERAQHYKNQASCALAEVVSTGFDRSLYPGDEDMCMEHLRTRFPNVKHLFVWQCWHTQPETQTPDTGLPTTTTDAPTQPAQPRSLYERMFVELGLKTLYLRFTCSEVMCPPLGIVRRDVVPPGGFFFVDHPTAMQCVLH